MGKIKIVLDIGWLKNREKELTRTVVFSYKDNLFKLGYRIANIIDPVFTVMNSGLRLEHLNSDKNQHLFSYEDFMPETIELSEDEFDDLKVDDLPLSIIQDFDKFQNICVNYVVEFVNCSNSYESTYADSRDMLLGFIEKTEDEIQFKIRVDEDLNLIITAPLGDTLTIRNTNPHYSDLLQIIKKGKFAFGEDAIITYADIYGLMV